MRFAIELSRGASEVRASPEDPRVPVSAANFLSYFGVQTGNLPAVTIESALTVPAVSAAVSFLSGSMANLPLHAYRAKDENSERIRGGLQTLLNEAPNPEWSSFGWRKYFWQQVFTGGRGLSWIERNGPVIIGIWPINPVGTEVVRREGRKFYKFEGREYPAADVIDVPFMLKPDQLGVYSPVVLGAKAIGVALAMGDYAGNFFAGGGVPPLVLEGPIPNGPGAYKRAMDDVMKAIDTAKSNSKPVFGMPPGHTLKPVGFDPEKGQMTEARRFQIEEIARLYNLPPVFLQDLTHGTFSNTEQQDLHLVKHLISQWAKAFEDELNLKLFGQKRNARYVEHSLDALMRGDFKTRMDALASGVQNALLMPDEARALENRPKAAGGDRLYIQGATVPLQNQAQASPNNGGANDPGNPDANPTG